jgi:hypothetical protein
MKTYQHTQRGPRIVMLMVVLAVVGAVVGSLFNHVLFVTVPILLMTAWLFSSLTITIAEGELRWHFGCGIVRKKVSLADIASAKIVKTNAFEGWGIHLSRFGWLYNIAGYDAIAVTLKSGKRFAIGTNEPNVLSHAIIATIKP